MNAHLLLLLSTVPPGLDISLNSNPALKCWGYYLSPYGAKNLATNRSCFACVQRARPGAAAYPLRAKMPAPSGVRIVRSAEYLGRKVQTCNAVMY
jgi:hypothetical protein